jgi:thiol-disulfide isomerase/thioredoxin
MRSDILIIAAVLVVLVGVGSVIITRSPDGANLADAPVGITQDADAPEGVATSDAQDLQSKGETKVSGEPQKKAGAQYKEIVSPSGFLNTGLNSDGSAKPITISELVGKKVILLDIMTYSCINCQRTFPYINAWYKKYKDQGLVVIGIHTPEFAFEKNIDNVRNAMQRFGIVHPVVLDNEYATWNAYGNRFWPRKYLIDIDGYVAYDHIGEGAYDETERKIQELLEERRVRLGEAGGIAKDISSPSGVIVADPSQVGSPEIYFGALRNGHFGNGAIGYVGPQSLVEPSKINLNRLYLAGDWNIQPEYAESKSANAKIMFRYKAKNVYFVASADSAVTVRLFRDGKPLGGEAGEDAKFGSVTVQGDRLYKLIEDSAYGEHTLEMIIEGKGLKAFTFTFG